jgi:hypothetical protein
MQLYFKNLEFTWYDAGLIGLFLCTVAGVSSGLSSTSKENSICDTDLRAWKRVMRFVIPVSPYFVLALVAAIVESVCSTLQPLFIGSAIDLVKAASLKRDEDITAKGFFRDMVYTCVAMISLDAIKCIAIYGRERLNNGIGDSTRKNAQVLTASVHIVSKHS